MGWRMFFAKWSLCELVLVEGVLFFWKTTGEGVWAELHLCLCSWCAQQWWSFFFSSGRVAVMMNFVCYGVTAVMELQLSAHWHCLFSWQGHQWWSNGCMHIAVWRQWEGPKLQEGDGNEEKFLTVRRIVCKFFLFLLDYSDALVVSMEW
jgi:hypothetical protein